MIRLIAIDLDDTLLAPDLTIPEPSRQALRKAFARGVAVVVATGRMYRSALPYARELGLSLPLITYNGALVKTAGTGEVLSHTPVPRAEAEGVAALCAAEELDLNVYLEDELYVARRTTAVKHYEAIAGLPAHEVGDLVAFLRKEAADPTKLLILTDPEEGEAVTRRLAELYRGALNVMRSRPRFVEIVREGVDKWWGVLAVAERLQVSPAEIMAIGDSLNDREMIRRAGLGVAVPHAPASLQAEADYVTQADDGLGVAEAIERFVLSQE
ncbi:MAG: Cof-type HAD-IIB family hydrolase [Bacillota bacterium]|nr:Cof-type HAD-IIB family hydrolase [Bacillota bacterium]